MQSCLVRTMHLLCVRLFILGVQHLLVRGSMMFLRIFYPLIGKAWKARRLPVKILITHRNHSEVRSSSRVTMKLTRVLPRVLGMVLARVLSRVLARVLSMVPSLLGVVLSGSIMVPEA